MAEVATELKVCSRSQPKRNGLEPACHHVVANVPTGTGSPRLQKFARALILSMEMWERCANSD